MDISIPGMRTKGTTGSVKAFFTARIGEFEIEDMRLIEGKNGIFVGFPSKKITTKDGETKFIELVRLNRGSDGKFTEGAERLRDQILKAAKAEYDRRESGSTQAVEEDDQLPF